MDERSELSLLEKQEGELIKALCDVRHAAEAQRIKIKELVKGLPSPIDRLPNELFVWIICLSIHANNELQLARCSYGDVCDWKTQALMKVSRHWRNTVIHCPKLWSTILVEPSLNVSHLKACVERSSPSLVDVEINYWQWLENSYLNEMLDVATLCADRWRSVRIFNADHTHTRLVLQRIEHLILPSLARISMHHIPAFSDENSVIFSPQIFTPGNSPSLEYLEIGGDFITSSGLPILSSLKELHIHLPHHTSNTAPTYLERLSLYPRLARLTLSGNGQTLGLLRPNSIQLPFLDKLICKISKASSLPRAIVAPMLSHFEYSPDRMDPYSVMFTGLGSKFSSVSRLILCPDTWSWFDEDDICSVFPNVRHVELHKDCANIIFQSPLPPFTWQHLEYLSIVGGEYREHVDCEEISTEEIDQDTPNFLEGLTNWLQLREDTGQSMLRIKISTFVVDAKWISDMHDALHGLCVLEWANNAFTVSVGLSGNSTAPWLVCEFFSYLGLRRNAMYQDMGSLSPGFTFSLSKSFLEDHIKRNVVRYIKSSSSKRSRCTYL